MRCSQVAPLSVLAAFHGVVAVYFKENYNLFVTNTTHTILSSTVGFLLLLKATLCYRHYGAAKQVLWPRQRARWLDPHVLSDRHSRPLLQAGTGGRGWRAAAPDLTSLSRACPQTIKDAIDCIRTLAVHVNSYGVVTSEDQARSIVKTHADLVSSAAVALLT